MSGSYWSENGIEANPNDRNEMGSRDPILRSSRDELRKLGERRCQIGSDLAKQLPLFDRLDSQTQGSFIDAVLEHRNRQGVVESALRILHGEAALYQRNYEEAQTEASSPRPRRQFVEMGPDGKPRLVEEPEVDAAAASKRRAKRAKKRRFAVTPEIESIYRQWATALQ